MELLTPTEIYVRDVLRVVGSVKVTGMVDVTGGGLKNFVRLRKGLEYRITDPIEPQPIFKVLQRPRPDHRSGDVQDVQHGNGLRDRSEAGGRGGGRFPS